jgi:hypothetical protein
MGGENAMKPTMSILCFRGRDLLAACAGCSSERLEELSKAHEEGKSGESSSTP